MLAPVRVPIFHPYSDAPDDGIDVLAYAYEEAFGEKRFGRSPSARDRAISTMSSTSTATTKRVPSPAVLLDVLRQKCEFKGIAIPKAGDLDGHKADLEARMGTCWRTSFRTCRRSILLGRPCRNSLRGSRGRDAGIPAAYTMAPGETVLRERTLRLPVRAVQSHLEVIRFAAANRLCVELNYADEQGRRSTRMIEPYSLRRTQDDNFILHTWDVGKDAHRGLRIDRFEGARITDRAFTPRYAVELTPSGPLPVQETERRSPAVFGGYSGGLTKPATRPTRPQRAARPSFGPTYVYQCGMCGKKFSKKKISNTLGKHKAPGGFPCSGRTGYLIDTKY